jgi:hypothetical protein
MARHRHNYPTKAEVDRLTGVLVMAAKAAGLKVSGVEIGPDGAIRVVEGLATAPADDYDRWKAAQDDD